MLTVLLFCLPAADPVPDMAAESAAAVQEAAVGSLGFESLFNGVDLSGWVVPEGDNGHWRVVDGVIDYDARSEAPGDKNVRTEREFKNFVLELEWRISEQPPVSLAPIILPDGTYLTDSNGGQVKVPRPIADSGIYLRGQPSAQVNIWGWPAGSGEMYGYRNASSGELKSKLVPTMNADRPLGEWNRFTIVLIGRTLTVLLNDQLIVDRAELPEKLPESGPIVLQHHGGVDADGNVRPSSATVQFRNIRVKELP